MRLGWGILGLAVLLASCKLQQDAGVLQTRDPRVTEETGYHAITMDDAGKGMCLYGGSFRWERSGNADLQGVTVSFLPHSRINALQWDPDVALRNSNLRNLLPNLFASIWNAISFAPAGTVSTVGGYAHFFMFCSYQEELPTCRLASFARDSLENSRASLSDPKNDATLRTLSQVFFDASAFRPFEGSVRTVREVFEANRELVSNSGNTARRCPTVEQAGAEFARMYR